jgi:hypothetical protein
VCGVSSSESPDDVKALRDELEAVRLRNTELETERGSHGPAAALRSNAVVLLLVLGTLCMTLAPVTIWGRNLVLNTDRYVKILTPVASNPGVQNLVIKAVDKQFTDNIDVSSVVTQTLPPAAAVLAGPIEGAVSGLVNTVVTRFVQSPAFKTLWIQINRVAHTQLVYLLTGKNPTNGALTITSNDQLVLQLAPIVEQVKAQLVSAGLTVASKIPVVGATINIAQVKGFTSARKAVHWLNTIADVLPWLGLAFFGGAIATARRRRRAVMTSAFCTAGAMVLVGVLLLVGRNIYLNNVNPAVVPHDTAKFLFDTLVRYLRDGLRIIFVLALLVALAAWLSGPSRRAVAFRERSRTDGDAALAHLGRGPVGRATVEHVTAFRVTVIVVPVVAAIFLTSLTLTSILVTAAVIAILLLAVEAIRHEAGGDSAAAAPQVT